MSSLYELKVKRQARSRNAHLVVQVPPADVRRNHPSAHADAAHIQVAFLKVGFAGNFGCSDGRRARSDGVGGVEVSQNAVCVNQAPALTTHTR